MHREVYKHWINTFTDMTFDGTTLRRKTYTYDPYSVKFALCYSALPDCAITTDGEFWITTEPVTAIPEEMEYYVPMLSIITGEVKDIEIMASTAYVWHLVEDQINTLVGIRESRNKALLSVTSNTDLIVSFAKWSLENIHNN